MMWIGYGMDMELLLLVFFGSCGVAEERFFTTKYSGSTNAGSLKERKQQQGDSTSVFHVTSCQSNNFHKSHNHQESP